MTRTTSEGDPQLTESITSPANASGGGATNIGPIVGGVIGGLVGFALVIGLAVYLCILRRERQVWAPSRRRRRRTTRTRRERSAAPASETIDLKAPSTHHLKMDEAVELSLPTNPLPSQRTIPSPPPPGAQINGHVADIVTMRRYVSLLICQSFAAQAERRGDRIHWTLPLFLPHQHRYPNRP